MMNTTGIIYPQIPPYPPPPWYWWPWPYWFPYPPQPYPPIPVYVGDVPAIWPERYTNGTSAVPQSVTPTN